MVFEARRSVTRAAIEEMLKHSSNRQVLFLLDYVEQQTHFDEVVDFLAEVNDESDALRTGFIATSRSAFYLSRLSHRGRHVRVDLSPVLGTDAAEWMQNYRSACVTWILRAGDLHENQSCVYACRGNPVLAAFMLFLHRNGHDSALEELLRDGDFSVWIARRVHASFGDRPTDLLTVKRWLALHLPLFPMAEQTRTIAFQDEEAKIYFDRLRIDGWVEREPEGDWRTLHDVFADQILIDYTATAGLPLLEELIEKSEKLLVAGSLLTSLQRVSGHDRFPSPHWVSLIATRLANNPAPWQSVRSELLKSSLLGVWDIVRLLNEQPAFWEGAESDVTFQLALAQRCKELIRDESRWNIDAKGILAEWLARSTVYGFATAFTAAMGLRLDSQKFGAGAMRWLISHHDDAWSQYVLSEWCRIGLPLAEIRPHLSLWLKRFAPHLLASFPIGAWLDAKGDLEVVREPIRRWLEKHELEAEAEFVYTAWLNAKGELEVVREPIKRWLEKHELAAEAEFLYKAWLDAKGELEVVRPSIRRWLEKHELEAEAEFVYEAWLDAKGELEVAREPIRHWLEKHELEAKAKFVYTAWLNAKGELELVRDPIKRWLEKHELEAETEFLYKAWLDAKGELEGVRPSIRRWLEKHELEAKAGFVYEAWLERKGELEIVRQPIRCWLEKHELEAEAGFVYEAWLNAKGELEVVRDPIKRWLEKHELDAEAEFLYKPWLDAKGELEIVRQPIRRWLEKHELEASAGFVYEAWLNATGELEVVRQPIRRWLEKHQLDASASHVYKAWLDAQGELEVVRGALQRVCAWVVEHPTDISACELIGVIETQNDLPEPVVRAILTWCRTFPKHEEVLWRLTQLGRNLFAVGAAEDVVETSENVLAAVFSAGQEADVVTRGQVTTLISYLIDLSQTVANSLRERVNTMFIRWLSNPLSYGRHPKPHRNIQRVSFLETLVTLLETGGLDTQRDRSSLRKALEWVDEWDNKWKYRSLPFFLYLHQKHPEIGVWDIIRIVDP